MSRPPKHPRAPEPPSVAISIPPLYLKELPYDERLQMVFNRVFKMKEWTLDGRFETIAYCREAVSGGTEKSQNLIACIDDCTSSRDWVPLFTLLEKEYPPGPKTFTITDVLEEVRKLLDSNKDLSKRAQNDPSPVTDPNERDFSFFMGGFGELYNNNLEVRDRVDRLFSTDKNYQARWLFNTSGSGKTRLLIEGLCRVWGFYFTVPDIIDDTGKGYFSGLGSCDVRISWDRIETAEGFHEDILSSSPETRSQQHSKNALIARRVFMALLLSRSLILENFFKLAGKIEHETIRRRWIHLQLIPFMSGNDDIFTTILKIILQCKDLKAIIREAERAIDRLAKLLGDTIWIVQDETQKASKKFTDSFHSEKNRTGEDHGRFIVRAMLASFISSSHTRIILSGTSLLLDPIMRNGGSNVAKRQGDFVVFSDTGEFDTRESQTAYINEKLIVSAPNGVPQRTLDRAWQWLRGRYRFTALFVALVLRFGIDRADILLSALVERLSNGYKPTDIQTEEPTEAEMIAIRSFGVIDLSCLEGNKELQEELANACLDFITKDTAYLRSKKNAEVVEMGFAKLTRSEMLWSLGAVLEDRTNLKITINEPLAIITACLYFDRHGLLSLNETIEKRLRSTLDPQYRGILLESAIVLTTTNQWTSGLGSLLKMREKL